MDLQSHKRTLGIVHIIYGSMVTLIYIFIGVIISAFAPFIMDAIIEEEGKDAAIIFEMIASVGKLIIMLAFFFSALPSIIGGIGLLQNKNWGVVVALVAGCVSIFSFPFGTLLGIYSIYVFLQYNKEKMATG